MVDLIQILKEHGFKVGGREELHLTGFESCQEPEGDVGDNVHISLRQGNDTNYKRFAYFSRSEDGFCYARILIHTETVLRGELGGWGDVVEKNGTIWFRKK